jgi:hypothetical protein
MAGSPYSKFWLRRRLASFLAVVQANLGERVKAGHGLEQFVSQRVSAG